MGEEALRALVDRASRTSDPCASLRALTALRQELQALEREQVTRALRSGRSYTDVAQALGVSRQAAHRRYRHLNTGAGVPAEPPRAQPPRRPSRVVITTEVREAVAHAREEARALGALRVGTEHLLLGILHGDRSPVTDLLRELGVDLDLAREKAQPTGVIAAADLEQGAAADNGISQYARSVFDQSLREAVARGDGYVGLDHLLLAALRDDEGGACRTLRALGVDPEDLRRRLRT